MFNITAILQARISSSRLPGKVLKPVLGKPMLQMQIERIMRCKNIDKLVVATSSNDDDNDIASLCDKIGVACFRGSLENVLDRFYGALRTYPSAHIVRLTGDCPLTDSELIDDLIEFYLNQDCDYASNCRPPSLPDGLDAEIFSSTLLETVWKEAKDTFDLEHVVPYITRHSERFRCVNLKNPIDYSNLRWTVDEPEDYTFICRVYEELYSENINFSMSDIIALLGKNPELELLNSHYSRNEGSIKEPTHQ